MVQDVQECRKAKIRQKSLLWIDGNIRKEMNKWYKLLKACNGTDKTSHTWREYKKVKNKVTRMILKEEAQYWKKQFIEAQEPKGNKMEHIYHITPTINRILIDTNKLNKDLRER